MQSTFEKFKHYLNQAYGLKCEDLTENTMLFNELEITGDDVDEFFFRLIEDFSIDVKILKLSNFHTGYEPFDVLSSIINTFMKDKSKNKKHMKVKDIIVFIENGILK